MLKVPAHEVERAAFPAVDVHNHVNDARGDDPPVPVAELVARMDRVNVKRIVILTGRWGEALQGVIDRMVKPHPDRFTVFTEPDWSRIDEPGFGEAMAAQVRDSFARGARGLKVLKSLGLVVRDRTGRLVTVDDPRLDPMWAECGRLGIPVSIHTSDPDAFFEPLDATNERWDELGEHPDWSFHGPKFPPKRALLDARNRVGHRIQRNLDGIQIALGSRWKLWMQVVSITLTVLFVELGILTNVKNYTKTTLVVGVVLGIVGGYLAPVTRDVVAALQSIRKG